jgi:plastocyanin
MKATLLTLLFFGIFISNAQTTHDLNWKTNSLSPTTDLTIDVGDTVKWTWTDTFPHTVENDAGSTETFDSGTKTGLGQTYSYTFSVIGTNPYFCGIHGAGSMSGTITVQTPLGVDIFSIKYFSIAPNPATNQIVLKLPKAISNKTISIYNLLGQEVYKSEEVESSIDISSLIRGMYFLTVKSKELNHTKRFIKR